MARVLRIMGTGIPAAAARHIVGDTDLGVTATGSSITDAYKIIKTITAFTTVSSSTGAVLPSGSQPGDTFFISNYGAQTLSVYPGSSAGKVQNGTAGAAFSVAANKCASFTCNSTDGVSYGAILSA